MREMDDDAARRALHTLVDEPAPPVTTTIDQVLRRGRRRVLVQRTCAIAGVVAVVAAIGVSAVLLRPGGEPDGVRIADSTAAPPPRSATTEAALPGWERMTFPAGVGCRNVPYPVRPPEPEIDLLPRDAVERAFVAAVAYAAGRAPSVPVAEWDENSDKQTGPRGYLSTELPMTGGNGQVQLEVMRYGGTPRQIADASLVTYANCEPPVRRVLDDGTILQMYPVNGQATSAPTRSVQVYRPDNRMYIVTAAGYSEADITQGGSLHGGRGALPLTGEQLARVAVDLARGLG